MDHKPIFIYFFYSLFSVKDDFKTVFKTSDFKTVTLYTDSDIEYRVCKKMSRVVISCQVNSFFPCTGGLWKSLSAEFFLLICDLNAVKSRADVDLSSLDSF